MVPSKGLVESALALPLLGQAFLRFSFYFLLPRRRVHCDTRDNLIIPQNSVFAYNFIELIYHYLSRINSNKVIRHCEQSEAIPTTTRRLLTCMHRTQCGASVGRENAASQ
jgi:hypothetical protein